ncbi:MAG: OB-fold-containig protein, partial [Pseudomonadota bacterium]
VLGLLILELVLLALGLTLIGDEGPALDADATGAELDMDAAVSAEIDAALDVETAFDAGAEPDLGSAEPNAGSPGAPATQAGALAGALSWLGIGRVPFSIWLAGTLTAFGLTGYAVQMAVVALTGATLPGGLAALLCLVPGLILGGRVARLIGRIMPRHESSAIARRAYHNRRGVITVGTARRGKPAQARFTDANGNMHFVMVEPLRDDEAITEGSAVAIVRLKGGDLRAIRLAN